MAISVSWAAKIIFVPKADLTLIQASPTEIREMDLNWFRLSLKDLEDDEDGMVFPDTHIHNPPVDVGGVTLGRVVEIINDYTVTFEDGQYAVNLVGANSNVADRVNVNQVSVRSANSAGLVTSAAIEFGEYGGAVTFSANDGVSGSVYPVGTLRMPSNNFQDVMIIANARGFSRINLITDATFTTGDDVSNMTISGLNSILTSVNIESGADVSNCEFIDLTINGVLDGGNLLQDCRINQLEYVNGAMHHCQLTDSITLGGGAAAHIHGCYSGIPGVVTPTIDMGGSGQSLGLRDYSGGIKISNMSGDDDVSIDMMSGQVILDSTVSNGTVTIRGNCKIIDGTTGTAVVEMDSVQLAETAYDGKVYIDSGVGGSGVLYPWGTSTRPVSGLSDAMQLVSSYGLRGLTLKGALPLSEDIEDLEVVGRGVITDNVVIGNGFSVGSTRFEGILITGSVTGSGAMMDRCFLTNLAGISGIMDGCIFTGTIYPGGSLQSRGTTLASGVGAPVIVDMTYGPTAAIQLSIDAGSCRFDNMSGSNVVQVKLGGGEVTVDSSCTGGVLVVLGTGGVVDNSGLVTIVDQTLYPQITSSIWDSAVADYSSAGGYGELMRKVLGLSQENIFIDNTVFDDDGQLTSSRVRVFDTKNNCDAATDGGSETTGLLATYEQESDWEALNRFKTYRQTKG